MNPEQALDRLTQSHNFEELPQLFAMMEGLDIGSEQFHVRDIKKTDLTEFNNV